MGKNKPINSVYLIALACCSLIVHVNSFYSAVVFGVAIVATYLVSLSIVSMIEKITDNHIRFIIFALITVTIITVLKIVCEYINIEEIIFISKNLQFALVPCLIIAIYPIYFEETYTTVQYFFSILINAFTMLVMLIVYGSIIEIFGHASFAGIALKLPALEFFTMPYGSFFVIATLCILLNFIRRLYIKKSKGYRTLVEKYKVVVTEIQDSEAKLEKQKKLTEGGEDNE